MKSSGTISDRASPSSVAYQLCVAVVIILIRLSRHRHPTTAGFCEPTSQAHTSGNIIYEVRASNLGVRRVIPSLAFGSNTIAYALVGTFECEDWPGLMIKFRNLPTKGPFVNARCCCSGWLVWFLHMWTTCWFWVIYNGFSYA